MTVFDLNMHLYILNNDGAGPRSRLENKSCDSMNYTSSFRAQHFNASEHDPTERSHTLQNVQHLNSKLRLETGGEVHLQIATRLLAESARSA
jgi:hypothetical protein